MPSQAPSPLGPSHSDKPHLKDLSLAGDSEETSDAESPPVRLSDALAFSSLLAAGVGLCVPFVVGRALGAPSPLQASLLCGSGAFIIYNLDRLRDVERDRLTAPRRTRFVEANRGRLTLAVAAVAMAFGALLISSSVEVQLSCLGIGALGFFHRRLKSSSLRKTLYVSAAWAGACVGLPWIEASHPKSGLWAASILFPVFSANLIASNLRDDEHEMLRTRPGALLSIAGAFVVFSIGLAASAPAPLSALGWIAFAEGTALLGFRRDERYGLVVIDGALIAGALASLAHLAFAFP